MQPLLLDSRLKLGGFKKALLQLNPTDILLLDSNGCSVDDSSLNNAKLLAVICRNPAEYSGNDKKGITGKVTSQATFNLIARYIRTSQETLCSGQLCKSFFSEMEKEADVFVLLYLIEPRRQNSDNSIRLSGFVSCKDLSLLEEDEFKHGNVDDCDYENGQKTLYIDAICAKLQSRISNSRQLKLGKILLSITEQYAISNNFTQIKLSALGYVINYYRSIGYLHDCGCGTQEDEEIRLQANKFAPTRLTSEKEAYLVYGVEKIIKFLDKSRDMNDIENDFIIALKQMLENPEYPGKKYAQYADKNNNNKHTTEKILESLPILKTRSQPLTLEMIKTEPHKAENYYGYYELLLLLIRNKMAVECEDGKYSERFKFRDEDGDEIDCTDEGFTMRKCLVSGGGSHNLIQLDCLEEENKMDSHTTRASKKHTRKRVKSKRR